MVVQVVEKVVANPLVALFRQMADDGFLNKAFVSKGPDMPIQFCDDVGEVIPMLRMLLTAKSAETVPAPGGAELM